MTTPALYDVGAYDDSVYDEDQIEFDIGVSTEKVPKSLSSEIDKPKIKSSLNVKPVVVGTEWI